MNKLPEGEREKLLHLDELPHRRLIEQEEALDAVTDAIIRAHPNVFNVLL